MECESFKKESTTIGQQRIVRLFYIKIMSSISPINELQVKLAERRSLVEGFRDGGSSNSISSEVTSKPLPSNALTKNSHRSSAMYHQQRGSPVVVLGGGLPQRYENGCLILFDHLSRTIRRL